MSPARTPPGDGGPRVTIRTVAAAAGVSTSTVSRVFSHPHLLRASTVERITALAAELGYVPHHAARALSTGRLGTIGVVVPDIANPFFPPVIRAAQARAADDGVSTLLADTDESAEREADLLRTLSWRTDGVVLVSSRLPDDDVRALAARRHVVLVNRDVDGVTRVLLDTAVGMAQAVDHLADRGHRRLAYVGGPAPSWSDDTRRAAVLARAAERSVDVVDLGAHRPEHDVGLALAPALVASGATAAIAFDDVLAQGVLAGLLAAGVDVPGDVSVVGCDDILAVRTVPPLTTIHGPSDEAGAVAVELLLRLVHREPGTGSAERVVLPAELVVRSTTGPAPRC
ncbi:transcriptional regulator, LacI family [Beutenbergia cavernae DSM 12333]|uniref:Transcriptional regulator, LacI family n=1 Tax=Beutenbergia cavernae (strain ATCC BAA-8 / DSM 12333 / CCUG 43141 / JCM 11478 / NBRC 16432 / NCIMB 13614 / HKI 0122) TaxID=471853 RepID=C5C1I9_BEUC1|nr:LacI family DNA-binding transcriptional regulator [Beutenbergia cavernae]ACQ81599.1 transcriptional regulator, LacI family [Beutenbergia cavernae DSM 12333]